MHICPNGKKYVGATCKEPESRWKRGTSYWNNKQFHNDIKKFGWENIEHIILNRNLTKEEAKKQERNFIKLYKTNNFEYGYNRSVGGEIGIIPSEETKIKISIANTGKKRSKETKIKLSEARKGKPESYKSILAKQKRVNQFDLNGKFIKEYESIKIALIENGWRSKSGLITEVCKGKKKSAFGYKWEHA